MIKKFLKKWCSLLWVMCVCAGTIFAQTELTNLNTTWSTVLGGKIISKPETTSYGIIAATDGRIISSISNNGVILWQKHFTGTTKAIIKTISDDFTVAITNSNKKITLYNPSGIVLWEKDLSWEITEKPYEGRDGRFFVRGKNRIACYGINGICKWDIKTDEQNIVPLQELNDGSIVVFLKNLSEGKTKSIRVSPFGTILEEITFSGEVKDAATCPDGVLLCFTDGSAGLFCVEKEKAVNKWVLKLEGATKTPRCTFVSSKDLSECYFLCGVSNGTKAFKIDTKTGDVKSDIPIPDINFDSIVETNISQNGLFLMDEKNGQFFNKKDILAWHGKLPDKNSTRWNYALFSTNNSIVFTYNNWSINSYKVLQNVSNKVKQSAKKNYSDFYEIDTSVFETIYKYQFNENMLCDERLNHIKTGFYGEDEILFASDAKSTIKAYLQKLNSSDFGTKPEKTIFETKTADIEKFYLQLPYFGTTDFSREISKLILSEQNATLLNTLLTGLQKNGYDPDGEILNALNKIASNKSKLNPLLIDSICDAVYSICRFMGRPAFNKNGKQILKNFLSTNANNKARDTFKALGDLDL